jgi:spore maturation protein SpmB
LYNLLLFHHRRFYTARFIQAVNVYESFIEGKDGFHIAVRIIPYLIAILVAGRFQTSGAWTCS